MNTSPRSDNELESQRESNLIGVRHARASQKATAGGRIVVVEVIIATRHISKRSQAGGILSYWRPDHSARSDPLAMPPNQEILAESNHIINVALTDNSAKSRSPKHLVDVDQDGLSITRHT